MLILGAAGALGVGIVIQIWSLQAGRVGRHYAMQLPAIFLYSLGGALILFTIFPESTSEGRALGFRLSGAAGFVAFFMLASFGWLARTRSRDEAASEIRRLKKENRTLLKKLTVASDLGAAAIPITKSEKYAFASKGRRGWRVGVVTGNLANVMGIDVWVNSENTRMEMSRVTEPTVSAVIRYYGGRRDGGGHVLDDVIAKELAVNLNGMSHVEAGQILTTSAGELLGSHGVKRIVHVAAVEGEPGSGYRPVLNIGKCVQNVLAEVDRLNSMGESLRSVMMPLLGTGGGHSSFQRTADVIVASTVDYLAIHGKSKIREVYLLAYTEPQRAACELSLEADDRLAPVVHPK